MCEARFALASITKPGTTSPPPRPGRDVVCLLLGRSSVSRLNGLCGNLLRRPVELGAVDPHPVQDDGELARYGTLALLRLLRFAIRLPQALSADHLATRVSSTLAASYR